VNSADASLPTFGSAELEKFGTDEDYCKLNPNDGGRESDFGSALSFVAEKH